MEKLALFGSLGLLLAACSCNGQKPVNGPELKCDANDLDRQETALWQDLQERYQHIEPNDCTSIAPIGDAWLAERGDEIRAIVATRDRCDLPRPESILVLYLQSNRGAGCEASTPGHAVHEKILTAAGGRSVPLNQ